MTLAQRCRPCGGRGWIDGWGDTGWCDECGGTGWGGEPAPIEELIERSSLGTPEAKALRESVDPALAERIVAAANADVPRGTPCGVTECKRLATAISTKGPHAPWPACEEHR